MDADVMGALAEARALGFLGPGPLDAHVASADAFAAAIGPLGSDAAGLDLGSGGGVPGLLLAAHYGDVPWVLLDAHRRRTSFLAAAVASIGWGGRVEVVRAQAEVAAHQPRYRSQFSVVVARSFGPPAITAECAAAFLGSGGHLLVAEPPVPDAARWPAGPLRELGMILETSGRVSVLRSVASPREDVPRPFRDQQRRPLW